MGGLVEREVVWGDLEERTALWQHMGVDGVPSSIRCSPRPCSGLCSTWGLRSGRGVLGGGGEGTARVCGVGLEGVVVVVPMFPPSGVQVVDTQAMSRGVGSGVEVVVVCCMAVHPRGGGVGAGEGGAVEGGGEDCTATCKVLQGGVCSQRLVGGE